MSYRNYGLASHRTAQYVNRVRPSEPYAPCQEFGQTRTVLYEQVEALVQRSFDAGTMRCTLTNDAVPNAEGPARWNLTGMQVQISSDFVPAGPLETWHDTEPFAEPTPEPVEETPELSQSASRVNTPRGKK